MEDNEIIELYFARNEQAVTESEKRYGGFCMGISMNILRQQQDAEECVNDTWVHTWNHIPPTRPHSFKAYVGRIIRNLSLNRLESRRHRDTEIALDELADCLPVEEEQADELPSLLNEFVGRLSDLDSGLFVGRYWYFYPVKLLAGHYGMTPNAATQRLGRIRERLRAFLEERGYRV